MDFVSVNESENTTYEFLENQMVCIDTSNHRIGINTLNPTCSLDISGSDGKINVHSISCKNLDISGIVKLNITNISDGLETFNLYYDDNGFVRIIVPQ